MEYLPITFHQDHSLSTRTQPFEFLFAVFKSLQLHYTQSVEGCCCFRCHVLLSFELATFVNYEIWCCEAVCDFEVCNVSSDINC